MGHDVAGQLPREVQEVLDQGEVPRVLVHQELVIHPDGEVVIVAVLGGGRHAGVQLLEDNLISVGDKCE